MTLQEARTIFTSEFLQQLTRINLNGNFGDSVMNPETVDIVQYFRDCNEKLIIDISTNGGARDSEYWQALAKLGATVFFCIDGLEDTHSLYRQNTVYATVIKNATTFIAAGGKAVWKMIRFDHNLHQFEQAKQLAHDMGFIRFETVDTGRDTAPVFNRRRQLTHTIGQPKDVKFNRLYSLRKQDAVLLEDITPGKAVKPITCEVKIRKSIYITSVGEVYPCCYLGFSPRTYGHGNYHAAANRQFRPLIGQNNALENSLETCISWFDQIEKSWTAPSFDEGRLVICNDVCGH
jgi:sulfatase maturation enzyme AslB (radical SAM superfamily)